MPLYPLSIIFSQRNASNTKFDEKYLSGSNIVFGTDGSGNLATISINNIITSISNGKTFSNRWVNSSHVGKIIVSPTILKNVCLAKLGDPYLTKWILSNGY